MTKNRGNVLLAYPANPQIGDRVLYAENKIAVYGPDPWCWSGSWFCWFDLDAYVKDFGEEPQFVPNPNKRSLGV